MTAKITTLLILVTSTCMAQWTTPNVQGETYYHNGNVGIGATWLDSKLTVAASAPGSVLSLTALNANAYFKIGLATDYAWIQSYGPRPLRINELGNNVLFNVAGGNVGIGTTSAPNKLTIGSDIGTSNSIKGITLGADQNLIEVMNSNFGNGYASKLYGSVDGSGLTSFRLAVRANSTAWSDVIYVRVADSGSGGGKLGYVGIGTDNPTARLTTYETEPLGATLASNKLLLTVGGNASGNLLTNNTWLVRDDNSQANWSTARLHDGISIDGVFWQPGTDTRTWWERDPNHNVQQWGHANQIYMTLDGGYLGLGTTTPDERLTVKGKIHTQEVRVDLTGAVAPDYVFEPTYNLLPLSEVESYIKANKHLPEVPSAKQMEEEGIEFEGDEFTPT
jgi:hypothetical protein